MVTSTAPTDANVSIAACISVILACAATSTVYPPKETVKDPVNGKDRGDPPTVSMTCTSFTGPRKTLFPYTSLLSIMKDVVSR